MRIRFLQTVPSETPDFPFQAGQIISVVCPTPYVLSLIDGVRAVVVADPTERAIAPEPEQPEVVSGKGRRRGRE